MILPKSFKSKTAKHENGNIVRKNILRNKKSYDRIELLKPTIKEMKKITKKIISNIGPLV